MVRVAAVLLLLSSFFQEPVRTNERDSIPKQPASSRSGLRFVQFSYEDKIVYERVEGSPTSTEGRSSAQQKLPPGIVTRNEPEMSPSRDLSDRMRELRELSTPPKVQWTRAVQKYLFRAQVKNETSKTIRRFFWTYQPSSEKEEIIGKDYLCNSHIEPGAVQAVQVLSPVPSARTVRAEDAGEPAAPLRPSLNDLSIKFIEFVDGSTWQDPDWKSTSILTRTATHKLGKNKCTVL